MNQKIEVGCMVMLKGDVYPENRGLTGVVIDHDSADAGGREWLVRLAGRDGVASSFLEGKTRSQEGWARTDQLMRIDDPGLEGAHEVSEDQPAEATA